MKTNTEINIIDNFTGVKYLPKEHQIEKWLKLCLCRTYQNVTVNIMITDLAESQKFNINFRSKQGPTNVLSFPYEDSDALAGDLVICAPLVIIEAKELHKTEQSHWQHLFVHGMLHLQGYDHQNDEEEKVMVDLENKILAKINNPKETNHENI